jgi:hypothetical protein
MHGSVEDAEKEKKHVSRVSLEMVIKQLFGSK